MKRDLSTFGLIVSAIQKAPCMPGDAYEIYLKKLREKLDAVAAKAMPFALAGDFDSAEKLIREVDRDIYGWLAMARMYIAAIASLGGANAAPDARELVKAMFERAVAHRENAYPMPHTQVEADSFEQGRAQDRGQVIQEIGFDPNERFIAPPGAAIPADTPNH